MNEKQTRLDRLRNHRPVTEKEQEEEEEDDDDEDDEDVGRPWCWWVPRDGCGCRCRPWASWAGTGSWRRGNTAAVSPPALCPWSPWRPWWRRSARGRSPQCPTCPPFWFSRLCCLLVLQRQRFHAFRSSALYFKSLDGSIPAVQKQSMIVRSFFRFSFFKEIDFYSLSLSLSLSSRIPRRRIGRTGRCVNQKPESGSHHDAAMTLSAFFFGALSLSLSQCVCVTKASSFRQSALLCVWDNDTRRGSRNPWSNDFVTEKAFFFWKWSRREMNNSDDRQISLSLSLSIDLRRLSLQPTRTVSKVDDDWPEQPPVGSGVSRRVTGAGRGLAAAGGGGRAWPRPGRRPMAAPRIGRRGHGRRKPTPSIRRLVKRKSDQIKW